MPFKIPINQLTPGFDDSGYKITGPDINDGRVIVNSITLKVEKENAKAMIEGYDKEGSKHFVTIFTAREGAWSLKGNFRENPKLLTTKKHDPREDYPLSQLGENLNASDYCLPLRYLAVLHSILHIKYDMQVWETLCKNDIFDIWTPIAPYNMLKGKREPKDPMILLLRIFEIEEDFSEKIIEENYAHAVKQQLVTMKQPVIPNDLFKETTKKITTSIDKYLDRIEEIYDTCKI